MMLLIGAIQALGGSQPLRLTGIQPGSPRINTNMLTQLPEPHADDPSGRSRNTAFLHSTLTELTESDPVFAKTDPKDMKRYIEQLALDDLALDQDGTIARARAKLVSRPQSTKAKLQKTLSNISRNPFLLSFLKKAHDQGWLSLLSKADLKEAINRGYLMDTLTKLLAQDPKIMIELQNLWIKLSRRWTLPNGNLQFVTDIFTYMLEYKNLFFAMKKFSIQIGLFSMGYQLLRLKEGQDRPEVGRRVNFIEQHMMDKIPMTVPKEASHGLALNILQAMRTDVLAGNDANAKAGMFLIAALRAASPMTFFVPSVDGHWEHRFLMTKGLESLWIQAYTSWNAAFCTGNLSKLPVFLPKLFLPELGREQGYIMPRLISLALSIKSAEVEEPNRPLDQEVGAERKAFSRMWGESNIQEISERFAEEFGLDPQEVHAQFLHFKQNMLWTILTTCTKL